MSGAHEPPLIAVAADTFSAQPLINPLIKAHPQSGISLELNSLAGCAERLQDRTAGLGLISSFDFAALSGQLTLRIIPQAAVVTRQKTMNALILFRPGLIKIKTVAVDTRDSSLTVLLRIILKEKYRSEPSMIPMPPDPDAMLAKADAAMISGDQALGLYDDYVLKADLGEDWEDITEGLPFVHSFWAGDPEKIKSSHVSAVTASKNEGIQRIPDMVSEYMDRINPPFSADSGLVHLRDCVHYGFGHQEQAGVREFYSYCYYFGLIGDIPDLRFIIS